MDRLFIGNVHLVCPHHKLLDLIGSWAAPNLSTLQGMGPVHASKVRLAAPRRPRRCGVCRACGGAEARWRKRPWQWAAQRPPRASLRLGLFWGGGGGGYCGVTRCPHTLLCCPPPPRTTGDAAWAAARPPVQRARRAGRLA
eukprot:86647-Prymnesium_polylepis.1